MPEPQINASQQSKGQAIRLSQARMVLIGSVIFMLIAFFSGLVLLVSPRTGEESKTNNSRFVNTRRDVQGDEDSTWGPSGAILSQFTLQEKVESYLSRKVTTLLEEVAGPGNVIVRVSVKTNFGTPDRSLQVNDPMKTTSRIESPPQGGSSLDHSRPRMSGTNNIDPSEVNEDAVRMMESSGFIQHLSMAVLINGMPPEAGEQNDPTQPIARFRQQVDQLMEIARIAVGFDTNRNDEITVDVMPFWKETNENGSRVCQLTDFNGIPKIFPLLGAMITAMFALKSLLNTLVRNVGSLWGTDNQTVQTSHNSVSAEHFVESNVRAESRERIRRYFKEQPSESASLIRSWLSNDK